MTETAGGCVYDGKPLPGTSVRAVDWDGRTRLAIHGPTLMTRYLDAESPFFDEGGHRWLLTGDLGIIRASGTVEVRGRADDVIVSGACRSRRVQYAARCVPSRAYRMRGSWRPG